MSHRLICPALRNGGLQAATPVRRYLAHVLLDGTDAATALFAEIVDRTEEWLAAGGSEGWVRPTTDARARAVRRL